MTDTHTDLEWEDGEPAPGFWTSEIFAAWEMASVVLLLILTGFALNASVIEQGRLEKRIIQLETQLKERETSGLRIPLTARKGDEE